MAANPARTVPAARIAIWLLLLLPTIAFCLAPLFVLVSDALRTTGRETAFAGANTTSLLLRSVAFAAYAAAGATLLGSFVGYRLGVAAWRGKNVVRVVLLVPLALPPYLHAVGWTNVFQPRGFAANALESVLGISPATIAEWVYSTPGGVAILTLAYFPIAALIVEKSLSLCSPSLHEAAIVFGANRWQAFRVTYWPRIMPAAATAALIVFLLASSELGVPTILKIPVFNFEVFTQLSAFNNPAAAVLLTVPLLLVGLIAIGLERRITFSSPGDEDLAQPEAADIGPPVEANRKTAAVNIAGVGALCVVALGIPFGATFVQALDAEALRTMARVSATPALVTLQYAAAAALIAGTGTFLLAWFLRRTPARTSFVTDAILVIGFATPGAILALGLIQIYSGATVERFVPATLLIVLALVVRYQIVAYRIFQDAFRQIPIEVMEASSLDGANLVRTFFHIIFPLTRLSLLAVFLVMFILALGEIGSTILLYPPGGETLSIALYSIEANSPRSYVAAMTLFLAALSLAPLALLSMMYALAHKFS